MEPSTLHPQPLKHAIFSVIFYCSGAIFLCCLVLIVSLPYLVSPYKWIYFLAAGSGVLFVVTGVMRERLTVDRFDAVEEASWLTRVFRATSRDPTDHSGDD